MSKIKGKTFLHRFLSSNQIKVFFQIESIADLNTAKGFIEVLGIRKEYVVIYHGSEVDRTIAKEVFKGCKFVRDRALLPDFFPVTFGTYGRTRLAADGHLIVTYDPYKYCLPVCPSLREGVFLRRSMNIEKRRKIIVVSCSCQNEVNVILKACESLDLSRKPLLILALRRPNHHLAGSLIRNGWKVHERRSFRQPLRSFGRSEVVVLNTMGEFFRFLKTADLALVGYERNLFEPALLGIPVLYFNRPLNASHREMEIARLFRLFWRKNRTAKKFLDKFGGALPIKGATLHLDIRRLLRNPGPMVRGARKAVEAFRHQIFSVDRGRVAGLLQKGIRNFGRRSFSR